MDERREISSTTAAAPPGEGGIPLPESVTVRGRYSGELARWLEEEVGIPAPFAAAVEGQHDLHPPHAFDLAQDVRHGLLRLSQVRPGGGLGPGGRGGAVLPLPGPFPLS